MFTLKKLVALIMVAGILTTLTSPAFAGYQDGGAPAAAQRMRALGLIQGRNPDNPNDLSLGDNITRAELVTIIVRAFGRSNEAKFLKGSDVFPDTAAHWASGEITVAKNMIEANGYTMGMPDGTFQPNGLVTAAQAVAFLVKFLGVPFDAGAAWPANVLDAAVQGNVITPADREMLRPIADNDAVRGLVFYLADQAFANAKLLTGKTVYTQYVKTSQPSLILDPTTATREAKATVSGMVSSDVVAVTVGTVRVTPGRNARFSASVDLTPGENSFTVVAEDLVGNQAVKAVTITRTLGAPVAMDVPSAITVRAGGAVDLPIVVRDARGVVVPNPDIAVTSTLGTYNDGKFVAGQTAGSGTATVTAGEASATVQVTVTSSDLAKLVISPGAAELPAGQTQKFTVTGTDTFGNAVTAPSSVTWTASQGLIAADGTFAALNGVSGDVTITATIGKVTGTTKITVYAAPSKIALYAPSGLVANGQSHVQIIATVLDGEGNVARHYNGTLFFASDDTAVVSVDTPSVAAVDGVASVNATAGSLPGTANITVMANGVPYSTVSLTSVAQVPTLVNVTADPAKLAPDSHSRIAVTAVLADQSGYPVKNAPPGIWTVDFSSDDTTVAAPATVANVPMAYNGTTNQFQGSAVFTVGSQLGATTITATVRRDGGVLLGSSSTMVATQLVGSPYRLAIDPVPDARAAGTLGTTQRVTVRVLDANGNLVTNAGSDSGSTNRITDLLLAKNAGAQATLPAAVGSSNAGVWHDGKATFLVTDTKAETITYTAAATWNAATLTAAQGLGKFVPGPAAQILLAVTPTTLAANGTATAKLTATVADFNGNAVTDGQFAVTFRRVSPEPYAIPGWSTAVVNTTNGIAELSVNSGTNIGSDDFTAEALLAGASPTISAPVTLRAMVIGSSNQLKFGTVAGATAGAAAQVQVNVYDATGTQVVTYDDDTIVTLSVTDPTGSTQIFTSRASQGVATFQVTSTRAGVYTLAATAPGLRGATGTGNDNAAATQAVTASLPARTGLTANVTDLAADASSEATVTVTLQDAYGNPAAPDATYNLDGLTMAISGPFTQDGNISFFKADGVTAATAPAEKAIARASFKVSAQPGTATITAHKTGLMDGSIALRAIFGGFVAKNATITVDGIRKATVSASDKQLQKVIVDLVDDFGNRVTDPGDAAFAKFTMYGDPSLKAYLDAAGTMLYTDLNRPQFTVANAGEVIFWVTDGKAETVNYRADAMNAIAAGAALPGVNPGNSTGTFTSNAAARVGAVATPGIMVGNGQTLTQVVATVQDANGNVVTDTNGTMKLQIPAGMGLDYADLQGLAPDGWYTAPLANGQALATIRSRAVSQNETVYVQGQYFSTGADTPTIVGTPVEVLRLGSPSDAVPPAVTGQAITRTANGIVSPGDSFAITFSEPTSMPVLTSASFAMPAGRSLGDGASYVWNDLGTQLTITTGTEVNLAQGDVVTLASGNIITDWSGNPLGMGTLFTVDVTAPSVQGVVVTRATDGVFAAGDTIAITFRKATNAPTLTAADFTVANGHTFGTGAAFQWNPTHTVLTITGAGTGSDAPTLATGDVVALADPTILRDPSGNIYGASSLFTADLTAPTVTWSATRQTSGRISGGDSLTVTFSEPTNQPSLILADLTNSAKFGTGATVGWIDTTTMVIHFGSGATLADGDTIAFVSASKVQDLVHNNFGSAPFFTVDFTPPTVAGIAATNHGTAGAINAGDTITIDFAGAFAGPTDPNLTSGDLLLSAGSFGTGATAHWTDGTHLVITLGTSPSIVGGETMQFASSYAAALDDLQGNHPGTALGAVPAASNF